MADINDPLTQPLTAKGSAPGVPARKAGRRSNAELLAFAELLFFAYRDFTRDPDALLQDFGFGRAHHRVLHFVNRHSGLRVADLLDVLKITKQSLGRVLKQLIDKGYIVQRAGSVDRRERQLYPTEAGRALAKRLAAPQLLRLAEALRAAGPGADEVIRRFLEAMINAEERSKVSSIMATSPAATENDGETEVS
jgi:DNA-binding MarR family transcriptional regulator